ncbi:hypothetical protein [Kerstersia similis]|uniref:hypothetical protein n=1 Tax=Kerstersia similis TaxID=206505 RepID=UPI0039EEA562
MTLSLHTPAWLRRVPMALASMALVTLLAACGGGSDSDNDGGNGNGNGGEGETPTQPTDPETPRPDLRCAP